MLKHRADIQEYNWFDTTTPKKTVHDLKTIFFFSMYSLLYRANSRTMYQPVYFHVNWIIALLKAKPFQLSPTGSAERRIRPSSLTAAVLPVKLGISNTSELG